MPSHTRRRFLTGFGTTALAGLAGCAEFTSSRPPAGSLRFVNDDEVPHELRIQVIDVGSEPADDPDAVAGEVTVPRGQRELRATATVQPGEEQTYETTFTEPVWYAIEFTLDDERPGDGRGTTRFHPAPPGRDNGRFLIGRVDGAGMFGGKTVATSDLGSFSE